MFQNSTHPLGLLDVEECCVETSPVECLHTLSQSSDNHKMKVVQLIYVMTVMSVTEGDVICHSRNAL